MSDQQLPGQLPLFTIGKAGDMIKAPDLDGLSREEQAEFEDEVCRECGWCCTSSKECVQLCELYDDDAVGQAM